jgi:hypothetical protein
LRSNPIFAAPTATGYRFKLVKICWHQLNPAPAIFTMDWSFTLPDTSFTNFPNIGGRINLRLHQNLGRHFPHNRRPCIQKENSGFGNNLIVTKFRHIATNFVIIM